MTGQKFEYQISTTTWYGYYCVKKYGFCTAQHRRYIITLYMLMYNALHTKSEAYCSVKFHEKHHR